MNDGKKSDESLIIDTELLESEVERKKLSNKQKLVMALSGVALALIAGIGISTGINSQKDSRGTTIEAPVKNSGENVPEQAKPFVEQYGNRYEDPISTYYAQVAYIANNPINLVMSDEYIEKYDMSSAQQDRISPLGFEWYSISPDTKINLTTSMEVFNKYTSKELSIYMNALSKNPTPEAVEIVDSQFMNYCSDTFRFTEDDEYINALMNTAKSVVTKYGSAANYSVAPAGDGDNMTIFNKYSDTVVQGADGTSFSDQVDLVINVVVYEDEVASNKIEKIENVNLFVMHKYKSDQISIGQLVR